MAERGRDSSWLLSDAALPRVALPDQPVHVVREFRMPTCIGKPARYGIADGTPAPMLVPEGRFRDRTLAWFSLGEERASEECAEFDVAPPPARHWSVLLAAATGVALLAIVGLLVS